MTVQPPPPPNVPSHWDYVAKVYRADMAYWYAMGAKDEGALISEPGCQEFARTYADEWERAVRAGEAETFPGFAVVFRAWKFESRIR